jgi:D-alanyl-D-alanine carboxypeptidase (penicillin-binding protein 5/6)
MKHILLLDGGCGLLQKQMPKDIGAWLLLFLLLPVFVFAAPSEDGSPVQPDKVPSSDERAGIVPPGDLLPNVTARSAVVIEASTGRVLYQRDMDTRRFPASTTKMMTLIVALENGDLDDMVTVSANAAGTEGSTLWLEQGKRVRLRDLLYGMMLVSGNDATVAVAEHIAGSVPAYARMMTEKAHDIGAVDTSFVNSSGLPDERHYTTAHDLARIAAYGYRNPVFEQIVSTKEMAIPWATIPEPKKLAANASDAQEENEAAEAKWRNENLLLYIYDGTNGVKTGYTDAAGRCLVSAAKRDGIQLIAVVLDGLYMWNDSIAMLDYGFSQVRTQEIVPARKNIGTVPVQGGKQNHMSVVTKDAILMPIFGGEWQAYETKNDLPAYLSAPIRKGDVVGALRVYYEGKEVASTDLLATEDVEQRSFFLLAEQHLHSLGNQLWKWLSLMIR